VLRPEVAANIRRFADWPGLTNLHVAINVIVLIRPGQSVNRRVFERAIGTNHRFFYVEQSTVLNDSSGREIFNRSVLAIDGVDGQGIASSVAIAYGAGELADPSSHPELLAHLPRWSAPSEQQSQEARVEMERLATAINRTRADVVVVSLHRYLTGVDPTKILLYTSQEINDAQGQLSDWLIQTFENQKPPLQEHFSAQVDIIMSMAAASDKELYVSNHSSSNREAFCRLFLSSHIPPGFRVTTGEIIDASCNCTGQLDVVVVNDSSPRLTVDATGSIIAPILADTVLSVIEVKTSLTADQLRKALSQLRPVKALMPTHSTLLAPDGRIIKDPLNGKIITGIFAFNRGADIVARTPEIVAQYPGVVDFIVIPDTFGYFSVTTLSVCGISVNEADVVNGYIQYTARGLSLAIVFGILNSLAATRRFSGSNYIRYLNGSWAPASGFPARSFHEGGRIIAQEGSPAQKRKYSEQTSKIEAPISEVHRGMQERRGSTDVDLSD
jgi:hypothetical protein